MKSETKEKIRAIIIKKYGRSPFPPRNPEEAKRRGATIVGARAMHSFGVALAGPGLGNEYYVRV